jgi:hypothetical protein
MSPGSGGGGGRYRGIWTEDIDEEFRAGVAPIETVGNQYVLAAEAPMEFSGHQVTVQDPLSWSILTSSCCRRSNCLLQ